MKDRQQWGFFTWSKCIYTQEKKNLPLENFNTFIINVKKFPVARNENPSTRTMFGSQKGLNV